MASSEPATTLATFVATAEEPVAVRAVIPMSARTTEAACARQSIGRHAHAGGGGVRGKKLEVRLTKDSFIASPPKEKKEEVKRKEKKEKKGEEEGRKEGRKP